MASGLRVGPYLQRLSPTELAIRWEVEGDDPGGIVWGEGHTLDRAATAVAIDTGEGTVLGEVILDDLRPGSTLAYRVQAGGEISETWNFSMPASNASFRFAVISDTQMDYAHPTVLAKLADEGILALSEEDGRLPDLLLVAGDLVGDGTIWGSWAFEFFGPLSNLLPRVPVLPVPGNHCGYGSNFYRYFHLPDDGPEGMEGHAWSLRHGRVLFVGLDSDFPYATSIETDWLEGVLDEAALSDDVDFVLVELHHPYLSELWPPGESPWTGEVIERLDAFSLATGVPVVHFFGHTHGYARGHSAEARHLWMNVATAGGDVDRWGEYEQVDYEAYTVSHDDYGFVLGDVIAGEDPTLTLRRYSWGNLDLPLENELRDEAWLRRRGHAPARPELRLDAEPISPTCPVLTASPFCDPEGDTHAFTQWQVAASCDAFDAPVQDLRLASENVYGGVDLQAGDHLADVRLEPLEARRTWCARVRYRDATLTWGEWSEALAFSTGAADPDAKGEPCAPPPAYPYADEIVECEVDEEDASGAGADKDGGCGCAASSRGSGVALGLLLPLLARRRRVRRPT
jgi:hypothetical protein